MKTLAPSASEKLPPLGPGAFRIVTKNIDIEKSDAVDGYPRRRFKTVMSSTIKDRRGDEIKPPALQKMRDQFREGRTIFMDHDHKVASAFGTSDYAEITQTGLTDPETGQPIYDLIVAGIVNEPNDRASTLADSLEGGYVKFGASIGVIVTKHKKNDAGRMDIWDVDTMEGSIVGIPMNQRSWVQKALEAIEELDEDDEAPFADDLTAGAEPSKEMSVTANTLNGNYTITTNTTVSPSKVWVGEDGPEIAKVLDTEEGSALQRQGLGTEKADKCESCGHAGGCDCDVCDCSASIHSSKSISADDLTLKQDEGLAEDETAPGGQEAPSEDATPETAPAEEDEEEEDSDAADQVSTEIANSYDPEDVVELAHKARDMAIGITERDEKIAVLEAENATLKAERDQLAEDKREAEEVIEKMLTPRAPRAQDHLTKSSRALPSILAPEIVKFLNKTEGDRQ